MKNRIIDTDVLIIGGGTAGCFAGITLGKKKDLDVLIVEKANIVRSGCLAAGVNAINAYVKSLGRSGQGTLLLQSQTAGEIKIPFQVTV